MTDPQDTHRFECRLIWTGSEKSKDFNYNTFSREYQILVDGKATITGSSAPAFFGDTALHNPEDLLVGALSACHMLTYLAVCSRSGVEVVHYEDHAYGVLARIDKVTRFSTVVLRPKVTISESSDMEKARALHDKAHANCFVGNSVNFEVQYEPVIRKRA